MQPPVYQVYALRFGTQAKRTARANFLGADFHDAPMPLDHFVWAIVGPTGDPSPQAIIVDTGMGTDTADKRPGRTILNPVDLMLARIGIDCAKVRDVVLTHLHHDHAGCMDLFPVARFHVQDAEMAHSTGRCMCHTALRWAYDAEHVVTAVRRVFDGRMAFHAGTSEIAPGVTLHLIGGHTGGLQVVRAPTARGWLVLASDAAVFWANIRQRIPFPGVVDVSRMLEGFSILESLAGGPDHIIPGHDPAVLTRFPAVPGVADVVRLDLPPLA